MQVIVKTKAAEKARGYVFRTDDDRFLDPTDAAGEVSPYPSAYPASTQPLSLIHI